MNHLDDPKAFPMLEILSPCSEACAFPGDVPSLTVVEGNPGKTAILMSLSNEISKSPFLSPKQNVRFRLLNVEHCRPLDIVDSKHLKVESERKLHEGKVFASSQGTTRTYSLLLMNQGLSGKSPGAGVITGSVCEPSVLPVLSPFLVMEAGSSSQKEEFDSYMKKIKEKSPEGWKWLDQIPPRQWALAHDIGFRYGVMKIDTKALFAVCRSFPKVTVTLGVMLLFSEMKDAFDLLSRCSRGNLHRGDVYRENVMKKLQESLTAYVVTPLESCISQDL